MAMHETPLAEFVSELRARNPVFQAFTESKVNRLQNDYALETVGEVFGTLHPTAPPAGGSKGRCTARGFHAGAVRVSVETRTRQLRKALDLPRKVVLKFVDEIKQASRPLRKAVHVESAWYLGARRANRGLRSARNYHVIDAPEVHQQGIPPQLSEPRYVPQLSSRLGRVWSQGQRGTCVAHAAGAQFTYLTGRRLSRQFLYHQCKMIDGIPDKEGTYCEMAMKVFSDHSLSGKGWDWGEADCGLVEEAHWPYDASCIEGNMAHTPPPARLRERLYQGRRWGNTGGEVIRCRGGGSRLVDDIRSVICYLSVPVTISLPTFTSFDNLNSSRTGRITMPLPGEDTKDEGWHAMLAVGFDDTRNVFIVRNSWSDRWAFECPYGLPGHAIVPYRYFSKYGRTCYAVRYAEPFTAFVTEERRLYNRTADKSHAPSSGAKRAAGKRKRSRTATASKRRPGGKRHKAAKSKKRGLVSQIFHALVGE